MSNTKYNKMKLTVLRYSTNQESTLGCLLKQDEGSDKKDFLCYTIEDEHREEKVMHETRVPAGTYHVGLRNEGGHYNRYRQKYSDVHKTDKHGMLCIYNADGWKIVTENMSFQYVLVHVGNSDDHTSGCLLTGDAPNNNQIADGFVGSSAQAYKRIYPIIAERILAGEPVTIEYIDVA